MIYYGTRAKEHVRREVDVARGGSGEASNAFNES